jgi:hypothetical protein
MKSYIFWPCMLLFLGCSGLRAQAPITVPAAVKSGFNKIYPDQQPRWNKEKRGYAAKFPEHGKSMVVHFNRMGHLTQRGWYIIFTELPEAAYNYLIKYYPGKTFTDILELENMKGGVIYKARLDGKEWVFNKKGIFIKKEKRTD